MTHLAYVVGVGPIEGEAARVDQRLEQVRGALPRLAAALARACAVHTKVITIIVLLTSIVIIVIINITGLLAATCPNWPLPKVEYHLSYHNNSIRSSIARRHGLSYRWRRARA
jgi:hypothetical protein